MGFRFRFRFAVLVFVIIGWISMARGEAAEQAPSLGPENQSPEQRQTTSPAKPGTDEQAAGSINGTVADQSGAAVAGARLTLTVKDQALHLETQSAIDGQFFFPKVAPGDFQLTTTAAGFAPKTVSGTLHAGEVATMPQIALNVADTHTEVQVSFTQEEVATEQIKIEEKQRVLGVIPNFYVSYISDAAPLTAKQKFKLASRTVVDPFTFVMVGGAAGIAQGQNHFAEYGQGAQGYGKRFGAGYADMVAGTFIGSAILPSLLKQDPRYFYKGTGKTTSRFFYAIGSALICKGDNKRWQVNYSNILGSLAAGGISNIYYPAQDRDDAAMTFENGAIGIGATAIGNLFQEFVIRKLTPKLPSFHPSQQ